MDELLRNSFSKIEENCCLEISNKKEFYILDCPKDTDCITGRCYIKDDGQFKVLNPTEKDIRFLAVDKCIFFDSDTVKKCDCIVYDNTTTCFIEIKDCKTKQRKRSKKDAKKQLKTTIEIFDEKVDIRNKEAYICLGTNSTIPSKLASSIDAIVEFEEELNTKLFEGTQKSFV